MNLSEGILDHALLPLASMSHSFSGLDDPPGRRHAIPMTAIGSTSCIGQACESVVGDWILDVVILATAAEQSGIPSTIERWPLSFPLVSTSVGLLPLVSTLLGLCPSSLPFVILAIGA